MNHQSVLGNLCIVWPHTRDFTLEDAELTDVMCWGGTSIRFPPSIPPTIPPFLPPLMHAPRGPLLIPAIHKQRPCNFFLPKLPFAICFGAGRAPSGERKTERGSGGRRGVLDGLHTALPGISVTFDKSWCSTLFHNNGMKLLPPARAGFHLLTSTSTSH